MKLGHDHKYEAIAVDHFAVPFTAKATLILWRCRCNAVMSTRVDGDWTLAQVRGEGNLVPSERAETDVAVAI